MRTLQLMAGGVLAVALSTTACNRPPTGDEAREAARDAADEARDAAGQAGQELRRAADVAGDRLSDGWLTTKVQARFFADEQVKARFIDVSTRDGVVTISGFVENQTSRDRALAIARGTEGVKSVNDALLIGQAPLDRTTGAAGATVATSGQADEPMPPPAAGLTDEELTSRVQARYFLDASVKARRIAVESRAGVVTLTGAVASDAERTQALQLARTTNGVTRVEDNLTVDASLDGAPAVR